MLSKNHDTHTHAYTWVCVKLDISGLEEFQSGAKFIKKPELEGLDDTSAKISKPISQAGPYFIFSYLCRS